MPTRILTDVHLVLDGNDLSEFVRRVRLSWKREFRRATQFIDTAARRVPALEDWSAELELMASEDAGDPSAVLWDLSEAVTAKAVTLRGTSAGATGTNPNYTGSCWLEGYDPFDAPVGGRHATRPVLLGDGPLLRLVPVQAPPLPPPPPPVAASITFGHIPADRGAADITLVGDSTAIYLGALPITFITANIPEEGLHRLYWAFPSAGTQPTNWSQDGFSLNSVIEDPVERTIDGTAYQLYLFAVANAVDHRYNGAHITASA